MVFGRWPQTKSLSIFETYCLALVPEAAFELDLDDDAVDPEAEGDERQDLGHQGHTNARRLLNQTPEDSILTIFSNGHSL